MIAPEPGDELADRAKVGFAAPDITEADVAAVTDVLRSGWLTSGPECAALERDLADYLGAGEVVAMSSCTAALETAFAALDLPRGARVGVPTWTFAASALAPAREGAEIVLLDVDAHDLNLSAEALSVELEHGLDAVVAVHFGGVPVDRSIHELCAEAGVPLVEDAAHALGGSDHRGRIAGQGSIAACLSFYATKNLTSGEGGALVTDDPIVATFARTNRLHGLSHDAVARYRTNTADFYDIERPGIKANLPDPLAALARSQLRRFDETQARRRDLVLRYRARLGQTDGLRIVPEQVAAGGADHLLVVVLPDDVDRGCVMQHLTDRGVGTSIHFRPLHTMCWFEKNASVGRVGTSVADDMAGQVLSLPLHGAMRPDEVDRVCDALLEAVAVASLDAAVLPLSTIAFRS